MFSYVLKWLIHGETMSPFESLSLHFHCSFTSYTRWACLLKASNVAWNSHRRVTSLGNPRRVYSSVWYCYFPLSWHVESLKLTFATSETETDWNASSSFAMISELSSFGGISSCGTRNPFQ